MPRSGDKRYNVAALEKLAEVLDLELYFGPPRDQQPCEPCITIQADGNQTDYSLINLYGARASAGHGIQNGDDTAITSLAFRRQWLVKKGIDPKQASLVYVKGDSMQPTLTDGAVVLIDHKKITPRKTRMFAFREGADLFIKRLEQPDANTLIITGDNPDYPTRVLIRHDMNRVHILGEVVWTARDV